MLETDTITAQPQRTENPTLALPLDGKSDWPAADWRSAVPSVSELTRRLRGHIEHSFFDVWVRGEISTLRKPVSGHSYFTLKDSSAQLSGVLFRGAASKLKFQIQEGMEVLAHGAVTVYESRGQYQLVCDAIEPCGIGALQLAFEQLKKKLHQEGLFNPERKRKLPALPRHIGIVTSATGAAVRDIIKVLSLRFPDRRITLFPAAVQGEKAAAEIVSAIKLAERWNREIAGGNTGGHLGEPVQMAVDVLIVGRGGGSLEDLWPFNEEIVARALFECSIPTVSAVGHEIDFTIADFVADVRAATPSAAAEMILPRKQDLLYQVTTRQESLTLFMKKKLQQLRLHLGHLSLRVTDPRERLRRMRDQLVKDLARLGSAMKSRLVFSRQILARHSGMLNSLSPLQVLSRGYCVTRSSSGPNSGALIKSIADTTCGQRITTQVSDGTFTSTVD